MEIKNDLDYANSQPNENELEKEERFIPDAISNSTFEAFREEQRKLDLAKELLTDKGMTVISEENKKSFINKLKEELEWYRSYGSFINHHFPNVDAEACGYADGDID